MNVDTFRYPEYVLLPREREETWAFRVLLSARSDMEEFFRWRAEWRRAARREKRK